jgi:hypothetical protein
MNQVVDTNRDAQRAIAIHEAGHAVAAIRLDIPISTVTIVAAEDYQGITIHTLDYLKTVIRALDGYGPNDEDDEAEPQHPVGVATDAVMVLLAGRLAEERILGRVGPDAIYAHDEAAVVEIVSRVCMDADEIDAFITFVTARTGRHLRVWRKQIEAVADALLAHGTLNEKGVLRAMSPPRKPRGSVP